ncbi:MAG: Threonine synthase [Alphaproteobacteria bacterium MarineAlpha4_Bin2]|nr:MAG: Threonine synthase [Alphaproteobacteria bacterium MarineAlpha4_Bin2]
MRYVSTRGTAPVLEFDDVLLTGLAVDGGLYLPERWPSFTTENIRAMQQLSYGELAVSVMIPFLGGNIAESDFASMVDSAYADFAHSAVAPVKQIDADTWLMELFHGPTLAFKDYPMQLISRLFDHVLTRRGERVTIVGATSGDTGSAAIEACRDREAIDIFILYPHDRISEVQRRQMTTVLSSNVNCVAVEGTFDDCQDLVKAMFADTPFRDLARLSAVNSINWARVAAQIIYYFHAAVALGGPDRAVSFAVPTGNFGNVFAAYAAKCCGLPVDQLIIGTNSNDILTRFFETGTLTTKTVDQTISPSMDIQISSNFERLLFDLYGRDGRTLAGAMSQFRSSGTLSLADSLHTAARDNITATSLNDRETIREMQRVFTTSGELIDPHTAIGVAAGHSLKRPNGAPVIAQAVAHPAKFPDAVEKATGVHPELPKHLEDLYQRPERFEVLPNDLGAIQEHVRARISFAGAA